MVSIIIDFLSHMNLYLNFRLKIRSNVVHFSSFIFSVNIIFAAYKIYARKKIEHNINLIYSSGAKFLFIFNQIIPFCSRCLSTPPKLCNRKQHTYMNHILYELVIYAENQEICEKKCFDTGNTNEWYIHIP